MRVCVFEDSAVQWLDPLTLTRPAYELRCGGSTLLARQCRFFLASEMGVLIRPFLAEICKLPHPQMPVNDLGWLRDAGTIMVNARWLPPLQAPDDLRTPHVALCGDEVAYAALPADRLTYCSLNTIDDCVESWKQTLPHCQAGGRMIDYPWDLVEANGDTLRQDMLRRIQHGARSYRPANLTVVGPTDQLFVDPTADIDPLVVADTTRGPVFIDRKAMVQAFTRLEGPCYIGPKSAILGAKIRGSTIGPACRVGGEVEASIIHGYTNKYHDGFLGHSYVGEWVNLGAGTQISDLRNDYQPISVTIQGRPVLTGLTKVGSFIGDHTKTGLNTLLNTGAVVGAFCNLLPCGMFLPKVIPSFCKHWNGQLLEETDLSEVIGTAVTVMKRRGCELTANHAVLIRHLHAHTAGSRRQLVLEKEQRRLRRSA